MVAINRGYYGPTCELELAVHERQEDALFSPAREILYGGAAGGGKSHLMRVAAITWCLQVPGLQVYLFRRSYEELQKNHMEGETGFPALLAGLVEAGEVRITKHRIYFRRTRANIFLNHLQYTKTLQKYQGSDIHVLLIDELTHFEEHEFKYLTSRLRVSDTVKAGIPKELEGLFPRVLCGSNPGGIGHHWVKSRYIEMEGQDPYEPMSIYRHHDKSSGGRLRQYIPAKIEDNPSLSREEYEATLEGIGDELLIQALKDGNWNITPGSMFGSVWKPELYGMPWHVHPGFRIPSSWKLWRGGDDGFEKPSAVYWLTQDPDRETIYVIDEIYRNHMLANELGNAIVERDMEIPMMGPWRAEVYNTESLQGAYDNSAFTDTGQSDHQGQKQITRGEQMNRLKCRWKPVEKWPGSRIAGIQNFHRLLRPNIHAPVLRINGKTIIQKNGKPMRDRPGIVFFKKCTNAIRTIPALPRNDPDKNIEDIKDGAEDHAFDGVRYGVQFKLGRSGLINVGGI